MSAPLVHAVHGVHEVRALAKLTLSLRVTGVRADGYHLLDSEMVTVDLADTLVLRPGDGLEVVVDARATGGTTYGEVPADATNLVLRALRLMGRQAHVRLIKRIPAGAGLGGGSATPPPCCGGPEPAAPPVWTWPAS